MRREADQHAKSSAEHASMIKNLKRDVVELQKKVELERAECKAKETHVIALQEKLKRRKNGRPTFVISLMNDFWACQLRWIAYQNAEQQDTTGRVAELTQSNKALELQLAERDAQLKVRVPVRFGILSAS